MDLSVNLVAEEVLAGLVRLLGPLMTVGTEALSAHPPEHRIDGIYDRRDQLCHVLLAFSRVPRTAEKTKQIVNPLSRKIRYREA